jgi:hypothetical protein
MAGRRNAVATTPATQPSATSTTCHEPRLRPTQLGSALSLKTIVIARRAASGRPNLAAKRKCKMGRPHKAGDDDGFDGVNQISPGWPAVAGHDTKFELIAHPRERAILAGDDIFGDAAP